MEIPFEECQWVNESYTDRIVDENKVFPLSDASSASNGTGKTKSNLKESLTEERKAPWEDYNNFPEFFLLSEKNIDFLKMISRWSVFLPVLSEGRAYMGQVQKTFIFVKKIL